MYLSRQLPVLHGSKSERIKLLYFTQWLISTCSSSAKRKKDEIKKGNTSRLCHYVWRGDVVIHSDQKNTTMDSQNKYFHWVNHQIGENRVSRAMLDSSATKRNLLDVRIWGFYHQCRNRSVRGLTTSSCVLEYWLLLWCLSTFG